MKTEFLEQIIPVTQVEERRNHSLQNGRRWKKKQNGKKLNIPEEKQAKKNKTKISAMWEENELRIKEIRINEKKWDDEEKNA